MYRLRAVIGFVALGSLWAGGLQYPAAPRGSTVDVYHGTQVPDPYRWLENPDSPETRRWIGQENVLTQSYFSHVSKGEALRKRLLELWSPSVYPSLDGSAAIEVRNGRYFFLRRDAGKNQPVLYWMSSRTAQPQVLLDPNSLSKEGTAALDSWSISRDGKRLAYGIARAGSDWQDVRIRNVDSGSDLPDFLEWIKFSDPEWSPDGAGIYYGRFPKPPSEKDLLTAANFNEQLCFHTLGEPQSRDKVVFERPDHKDWTFQPTISDDGRYLVVSVNQGTSPENLVFYRKLPGSGPFTGLITAFEAQYSFIGNEGQAMYFNTTSGAPRGRVIRIDTNSGNRREEIVPQAKGTLNQARNSGGTLYLVYEEDVASVVALFDLHGKGLGKMPLPGKGNVRWPDTPVPPGEQFISFESFTEPETLYSWKPDQIAKPFLPTQLPFDPQAFETRQVFYPSKDGTHIPMFLVGRKGFKPNSETPCLLWGYGGFDISLTPAYRPLFLRWVEMGGIVASANLRGGGEYGEEWHHAGMKLKKQNVFDDFISAAEWLIANHYTSRGELGIYGRSNGGLLIGAVLNQRPDLFGAAIAGVGVMDMLRFPKFTIGNAWTSDYGTPDNPADFKALRAYSPLHNIRAGAAYPPTLILTSDHDDRVVPAHSFKYAAALQHAQTGSAPVLIRIETSAGHGGGKPVAKQVEETSAIIEFLKGNLHASGKD